MASVGITVDADDTPQSLIASANASRGLHSIDGGAASSSSFASSILAYHWDGWNGGGQNTYFVGTDCAGGGANLPSDWDNRILSTTRGACTKVKHYDAPGFGNGNTQTTDPANPNLSGPMVAATSSLKFVG